MDSIQIENIKEIDYLKSILDRIKAYGIDVSNYYNELDTIIDNYEKHKKSELNIPEDKLHLTVNVDIKYELSINLNFLHNKLNWCTLFLSLMDITENWDLDISIDETFYSIYNNVENILEYIYDVDIQEKVVIKYYDLILKKILKDYKDNKYDYLEEYNNLKENNYLKNSVMRFLENKNIIFDGNINCYSLKEIIEKVYLPHINKTMGNDTGENKEKNYVTEKNLSVSNNPKETKIEGKKTKNHKININNYFLDNIRKKYFNIIGMLILNNILNFDYYNNNDDYYYNKDGLEFTYEYKINYFEEQLKILYKFSYVFTIRNYYKTKQNIDSILNDFDNQDDKNEFLNIIGLMISLKYFDVSDLRDFFYKAKRIDFSFLGNISTIRDVLPIIYKIWLKKQNCLTSQNLKYYNPLDPIYDKNFSYIDFKGIDLSSVDFTDVELEKTILTNTKAKLDPKRTRFSFASCNLEGCYILNNFDYRPISWITGLAGFDGAILVDSFDEISDLEEKLKLGIDERFIFNNKLVSYSEKINAFVKKRIDVNTSKKEDIDILEKASDEILRREDVNNSKKLTLQKPRVFYRGKW